MAIKNKLKSVTSPQKQMKITSSRGQQLPDVAESLDAEPRPRHELLIAVVAALSGRCLANLEACADWKVADLKRIVGKSLPPGTFVRRAMSGQNILSNSMTLQDCKIASGSTLQVAIVSTPVLFLAAPCSASELSKRRGPWRLNTWGEGACGGVTRMVRDKRDHCSWENAPVEAKEIATILQGELQGLESRRVCSSSDSLVGGEVIIIANAAKDPRKSCLHALRIRKEVAAVSDDDFEMDGEEDGCWCSAGKHEKAYSTWLRYKDDPVYHGNLWGLSTLQDADPKLMKEAGDEVNQSLNEAFEEQAVGKDAKDVATRNIAATHVMARFLERHFKFDFARGRSIRGEPLIDRGPVIYGGYAPDGSIVGILTARARSSANQSYCGDDQEEESEDGASNAGSEDEEYDLDERDSEADADECDSEAEADE